MWNIQDIKEKKKYVSERLKKCNDSLERDELLFTLLGYTLMLENRGTRNYTLFRNFIDLISKGKYTLIKNNFINKKYSFGIRQTMNEDYYNFLLDICFNVFSTKNVVERPVVLREEKVDSRNLIEVSKDFYKSLNDKELSLTGLSLLNKEEYINFSNYKRSNYSVYAGMTHYDFAFSNPYFNIYINNNILDYSVLTHEIMHGIDFRLKPKLLTQNYYGLGEIPTYTIDYLFIDYLDSVIDDKEEVEKLRLKKDDYLQTLSAITLFKLRKILDIPKLNNYKEQLNYNTVKKVLNKNIISELLEIESGVIAYSLYLDIVENNNFDKLKNIMRHDFKSSQIPDFKKFGLSNEYLLSISKKIGEFSKNEEKLKK